MSALALILAAVAAQAAPAADPLARQAMDGFATCVVERNAAGAKSLLAKDPGADGYSRDLARFVKGQAGCAGGNSLGSDGVVFAGALAEALVAKDYKPGALATAAAAPKVRVNDVTTIGQCVAEKDPAAVEAVLASTPGTKAEVAALNRTGVLLPMCVAKGTTMKLNKVSVRAIYALGAWQTLTGAPLPPPEPQAKTN